MGNNNLTVEEIYNYFSTHSTECTPLEILYVALQNGDISLSFYINYITRYGKQ
jgi:hypothetical protein